MTNSDYDLDHLSSILVSISMEGNRENSHEQEVRELPQKEAPGIEVTIYLRKHQNLNDRNGGDNDSRQGEAGLRYGFASNEGEWEL